jgi:hypothetical protein
VTALGLRLSALSFLRRVGLQPVLLSALSFLLSALLLAAFHTSHLNYQLLVFAKLGQAGTGKGIINKPDL